MSAPNSIGFPLLKIAELQTDLDWIKKLGSAVAKSDRGTALRALVDLLISIQSRPPDLTYEERDDALTSEVRERLQRNSFGEDLFSMAAENDADFDYIMFQDGREEVVFLADSQ